ncbi:MAG TPA: FAD-dependent oxidoreductase, partial [Solirubrobacterales bacterium]|nr:FAD-dependent oxidoreductase [Solirubrobacterales bacterium]
VMAVSQTAELLRLGGMNTSKKAIVIGGGPAGLTAAARLAEGGVATTLLEAGPHLGGRAASEHRQGFDLNQGPHALYAGGAGRRELDALGIELPWWNPASPNSVFVRDGRPRRSPGGMLGLVRGAGSLFRGRPEQLATISTSEWLQQSLPSKRARAAAAALVRVTTFVADQDNLSADVAAGQLRIGLSPGVRYLRGGWQSLVDALAAAAEQRGASLRTRAAVRAVGEEDAGWRVALDEESLHADLLVIAAGGPAAARALLGEKAPPTPGPPAELSVLDLGLKRLPRRTRRFALGVDAPTYLSRHSPPGHADGTLLSLASYAREPRHALEAMADRVQPGWREQAFLERFLPRMVAVSAIPTPAGGGLPGRPPIDLGKGLYLAGDWVGPKGWLVDAAISSGAAAAAAALSAPVAALA